MNKITRTKTVLYAALIFAGGLGTGLVTAPLLGRGFLRPPSPEQMSGHMLSMLEDRLDLSPEQVAQVKPVIDKGREDMQAIWLDTRGRVTARVEQINNDIGPLLSAEQKIELDKLTAERRERMRKRRPFGPPPPPH